MKHHYRSNRFAVFLLLDFASVLRSKIRSKTIMSVVMVCLFTSLCSNSYANEAEITQFLQKICRSDKGAEQGLYIVELGQVDLNADGVNETVALHQGNNFASYYVFIKAECGYQLVKDSTGMPFEFLQYASSSSCYPIGCLTFTACAEQKGGRIVQVTEARNTLDTEQMKLWFEGGLSDDEVTGELSIKTYALNEALMEEIDTEVQAISGDWDPSEYFLPEPFDANSCQ